MPYPGRLRIKKIFNSTINCAFFPGAPLTILMTGAGGLTEVHILYPKNITTSEFVYPKIAVLFYHTPKNPLVLFTQPKKIPVSFIDLKKSLLAKSLDPKKSLGPPSLKYVSGTPGTFFLCTYFHKEMDNYMYIIYWLTKTYINNVD